MNLEKLKQLFPNIKRVHMNEDGYYSFRVQGQLYAIPNDDLTNEQKQLIEAFSDQEPLHTKEETEWIHYLTQKTDRPPHDLNQYRFIVIHLPERATDPSNLRQSVSMALNKPFLFIWKPDLQLVLIEEISEKEEPIEFEEIMDVLSDDLDLKLRFFVSDTYNDIDKAPLIYHWFIKTAEQIFEVTHQRIVKQENSLLELLPMRYSKEDRLFYTESILKNTIHDSELLKTIQTVIEHHGNVTATAKALYMHRNSVQYRIDKFQEQTGQDMKNFKNMIQVYLAIQLIDS
ncbi:PucR family transcriptional regulator [Piscibacillus halophilus]|uniref:PucR family transcriptional regulator n=1 Tax=Piscibacillus halophilus TaxID=571933 RepID=UPI00158991E5|nr:helix-turn-helix domain-containing protein [Piscibacillus halophilus]